MDSTALFLQPFLVGLVFAVLLPLFGSYLRLRDEWLAAFAYAHVTAAGALAALALGLPPAGGGLALALLAALSRRVAAARVRLPGSTAYALLLLLGWAASVFLTANLPSAERLGHALFDGQLYFADRAHLVAALACAAVALPLLKRLSRPLLLAQIYPAFFNARQLPRWPVHLGFDLLAVLVLAAATMSLGVVGTFALVFVPPWVAFVRAGNWRRGLLWTVAIGVGSYTTAFALALRLDQPFGPMLAAVLVAAALLSLPGMPPRRQHCA